MKSLIIYETLCRVWCTDTWVVMKSLIPLGQKIVFHVEWGSNPFYLSVLVKFVANDGDIVQMDLMDTKAPGEWMPMNHSWGAIWRIDPHRPLKGPFSIRLTNGKPLGRIKINDPKPKAPALTPPSRTRKGIPILRSKRYAYLQYFLLLFVY
jgi:hypothetical protein